MLRIWIAILILPASLAWGHQLEGTWVGTGIWQRGALKQTQILRTELQIQLTDSSLTLKECWASEDASHEVTKKCYQSLYEVRQEKLYKESQWVGDIYPWQILIFESNSQVSEQMVLRLSGPEQIQFRYNFSTYDGEADYRVSELKRKPATLGLP